MDLYDGIRYHVESRWSKNIQIEYDFTNENYELLEASNTIFFVGLATLLREIEEHSSSDKRRIRSLMSNDKQIIEIACNGNLLEDKVLSRVNNLYRLGREAETNQCHGGSYCAGFKFAQLDGDVNIENFKDGIYHVRNVITIPSNKLR
jgi:hypothetical protein